MSSVGPEFLELQCIVIEKKIEFITLVFSVLVFRKKGVGNQLFYLLEFEIIFKLVTFIVFEAGVCVCVYTRGQPLVTSSETPSTSFRTESHWLGAHHLAKWVGP